MLKHGSKWALAVLCLGLVQAASAALTQATSRAEILSPTTVDWSALGPDFTGVGSTPSTGGVTVSGAAAYTVFQQAVAGSWGGNFLNGESLLASIDSATVTELPGVFDMAFASPISGFGTQVQAYYFGDFTADILAYDSSNVLLGSFLGIAGTSNSNADGSALFLGVVSSALDISRIVITVTSAFGEGAAINQLSLSTQVAAPPGVPEPATLLIAGIALGALRLSRRR